MGITVELVDGLRNRIGETSPPIQAVIDSLTARRYARAIGETDPVYLDANYARSQGYADVLVPPNFLPSYLDWTDGGHESNLRPDGTVAADMAWLPTEGIRIMGGGEEMVFHDTLVAGTEVILTSCLESVTTKHTRSGDLMIVLAVRNNYTSSSGTLLMESSRTVLGR